MTGFDSYPGKGEFWEGKALVAALRERFPEAVDDVIEFRGESTVVITDDSVMDVLAFLRDNEQHAFEFLTDVTAVHWPQREKPFDVVWLLYSFERNKRLRIKTRIGPDQQVPSVVSLWPTSGWLERECFDMFGIEFEGHPDLRRILMPDDFEGSPLRKEFPLKR